MKYDSFSLIDFMQECVKSYIPDLEMVNYMRSITKNLDTELIKTLFLDVNKLSGAIVKFIIEKSSIDNGIESTLLIETSLDVYISEKYIYLLTKKMNSEGYDISDDCQKFEDAFCYLSVLEKLKLLKEIKEKNTKIDFKAITNKYNDLLRFCCLVEREFKGKLHRVTDAKEKFNDMEIANANSTNSKLLIEDSNNMSVEKQKIDIEKLKSYFIPSFKGNGEIINHFDNMIKDLADIKVKKEIAQIAYMIYTGKKMNNRKPNTFSGWYKIFCECTGTKLVEGYKPCKLIPSEEMEKLFSYLK